MNIQRIQDKTNDERLTFAYILKKMLDCRLKKERISIYNSYLEYISEETNRLAKELDSNQTIHNQICDECFSHVDEDTHLCCNCGKKN